MPSHTLVDERHGARRQGNDQHVLGTGGDQLAGADLAEGVLVGANEGQGAHLLLVAKARVCEHYRDARCDRGLDIVGEHIGKGVGDDQPVRLGGDGRLQQTLLRGGIIEQAAFLVAAEHRLDVELLARQIEALEDRQVERLCRSERGTRR